MKLLARVRAASTTVAVVGLFYLSAVTFGVAVAHHGDPGIPTLGPDPDPTVVVVRTVETTMPGTVSGQATPSVALRRGTGAAHTGAGVTCTTLPVSVAGRPIPGLVLGRAFKVPSTCSFLGKS